MHYTKSILALLLLSSLPMAAIVPQEAELKAQYKSFRNLVDTFNKYTRISKRPMTDKEWQELKATAKRVGMVGSVLVLALLLRKGIQYALSPQSGISVKKQEVNLALPLTNEEFNELPILDRWQHVIITGDWDRLKEIISRPMYNPLHAIIHSAEKHDKSIVDGLSIVLERYPSKIDEYSKKEKITPVWLAAYKFHLAGDQSGANRLAQAITFLLNKGADISFQERLYEYAPQLATLQQTIDRAIETMNVERIINVNTPEIKEMQEVVAEKFAKEKK